MFVLTISGAFRTTRDKACSAIARFDRFDVVAGPFTLFLNCALNAGYSTKYYGETSRLPIIRLIGAKNSSANPP